TPQRDLAGVVEQRPVEARPDLKAIFALEKQAVRPAKTVLVETAQGVLAAQGMHQVEGHLLPRLHVRRWPHDPSNQHAPLGEKTHELAHVEVETIERIPQALPIV